jgi:hypothetical protein
MTDVPRDGDVQDFTARTFGQQKSHRNQTGAFAYMALRRPPTTPEYGLG